MSDPLLEALDDSFSGILWVTQGDLTHKNRYFRSINYLLDGIIGRNIPMDGGKVALFFTQAFGGNFFVLHMADSNELNERLGGILSNIKTQMPPGKKIVYVGEGNIYPRRVFSLLTDVEIMRL